MWFYSDAEMQKPELVIGIDFGTTHSGVSWAINDRRKEVHIIENWPDPQARNRTSHKVPSAVTYNVHDPSKLISWGFPAIRRQGPGDGRESEPFTWFKLLLQEPESMPGTESDSELGTLSRLMREHGKTVQDITVDYLRCIWGYTKEQLNAILNEDFQETYHMRVILTIPAVWTPNTIIMMKELAVKAGLPTSTDLLPEPEAAAVAVLKVTTERAELQQGDVVTVCDAGGGTCDLITYEIISMQPLKVKECVTGAGGFCGSVYIDKAFERYIKTLVGPTQYSQLRERDKKYMMSDFELGIKPLFRYPSGRSEKHVIDLRGVRDDIPNGIHDESITLKPKELNKIFSPTCLEVQQLVERQLRGTPEKKTKAVLLVGGFGESVYLFEQLQAKFARTKTTKILKSERAWSAVCRGATHWGLERCKNGVAIIESRKSRYNYGIIRTAPVDPRDASREGPFTVETGCQIDWLLKKGDEIMDGHKVEIDEHRTVQIGLLEFGSRRFCDVFLYSSSDEPPQQCTDNEDIKPLGYLPWEVDVKRIRWHEKRIEPPPSAGRPAVGKRFRKFKYTLVLKLGPAMMELGSIYRGKTAGMVEMPYENGENTNIQFKWVRPKPPPRRNTIPWT
ncbi:hypothetical protein K440DRAFT_274852 [Wilcoxina mikolae CBS 423.85]|nr:hypothetical protein K440DRAFT_274852 [Wilcoxina mikolae CBS 423.85]